ncbi:MAG: hypothetical protein AB7R55_10520 [Gemmatimonadales bacterium]
MLRVTGVAVLALCAAAAKLSAQQVRIGLGPVWRGTASGFGLAHRIDQDAMVLDLGVTRIRGSLGWMVRASAVMGEETEAIPDCLPSPAPCTARTIVAGRLLDARAGLVYAPARFDHRLELVLGPALAHAPDLADPAQSRTTAALHAGAMLRPLGRHFAVGLDAIHYASRLSAVRWWIAPRVELRL